MRPLSVYLVSFVWMPPKLSLQAVADVVRQLCMNLEITQPSALFALRDEQDQLVTDDNLRKHIQDRSSLK